MRRQRDAHSSALKGTIVPHLSPSAARLSLGYGSVGLPLFLYLSTPEPRRVRPLLIASWCGAPTIEGGQKANHVGSMENN